MLLTVSQAQVRTTVTADGSLSTAVTRHGNIYAIMGGTRPGNGPNLFHSFDRFSVGTGDIASFTGPQTGIANILSRVTGGQQSDIDGQLRTDGQLRSEGANLYLLNPAGVLFGPNASLDVSGSFHVSTADYLRLADGARFVARLSDTSTLSVAPPVAFGFLGPTPAAIAVQGSTLEVSEGQTLSVIGGDAQIVGGILTAPSGRINIASVASPGEVSLTAPGIDVGSFAQLGDSVSKIAQHQLGAKDALRWGLADAIISSDGGPKEWLGRLPPLPDEKRPKKGLPLRTLRQKLLESTRLGSKGLDERRLVRVQTPDWQGADFGWNSK